MDDEREERITTVMYECPNCNYFVFHTGICPICNRTLVESYNTEGVFRNDKYIT